MFNRFAKYEDAFRDWRRDGMPGLTADSYKYIEFLTSPDDDQAARHLLNAQSRDLRVAEPHGRPATACPPGVELTKLGQVIGHDAPADRGAFGDLHFRADGDHITGHDRRLS